MKIQTKKALLYLALASVVAGFGQKAEPTLKATFKRDFYVGAALNYQQSSGQDAKSTALITQQFNTISPENLLKWGPVHPRPDAYNFKPADEYVAFGQQHKMFIIGHTLLWHQQTPKWVFEDAAGQPVSREVLLKRLQDHINTVVGRYKGKIGGWDVVNEAIDDQQGDLRKTKWLEILGEDFAAKAFEYAHQADPQAELYYNDYSLYRPEKREGVIKLVKSLQAKGINVTAVGMQGHYGLTKPSLAEVEASIVAFSKLGVHVNFTELDIDVLPNPSRRQGADIAETFGADAKYNIYKAGLPDSVQQKLAKRYADLFALFHKHRDVIDRVTLWGVTDADSWLNNWPIRGRTSYPLLFGRDYQPKPAFRAVVQAAK
ncbi:endo-1,4-beta-xylanase [Hymenobacter sp. BT186]|uniref:Beta-xylanase n=1 Tax=Hymenobacter telluris TaxID=2816474 RepID=A0A939EUL3_9BACT|nr:endo-1,4-beta-xylanase [Hymenobacter telluris]MBO0356767.1 endo-1,4-beta-xylanase [Hymenobacter telluris]MBW3372793.1 endo-1,4-beta-xylanase [Hymenobacter norwichensis]